MNKKNVTYEEFVSKFKSKRTTDDCFTPPKVYDAVLEWARQYLGIGNRQVVQPFFPGGNYETYDYPENCVVIDNPPFSIFTKIVGFYTEKGIDFLLFAPAMTSIRKECTYIGAAGITYENGANVNTAFVTNMMGDLACTTAPRLLEAIKKADNETQRQNKKNLRKLSFPDCVLRATELNTMSRAGILYQVRRKDSRVTHQACSNGEEFGNSILLSSRATAEKLAAEKLAAEKLSLSEKSKNIIKQLNEAQSVSPTANQPDIYV